MTSLVSSKKLGDSPSSASFFEDDFVEVTSDMQTASMESQEGREYAILHEPLHFIFHYFSSIPSQIPESTELSLDGRKIRIYGMSEQEKEKEFQDAFNGLLEPSVRKAVLHQTLDLFLGQNGAEFPHLVERHREIVDLLQEPFMTRTMVMFVLGEEFFLRISPKLKMSWLLSKERLAEFLQLVEHFEKFALQKKNLLEQGLARNLKVRFSEPQDYLLEEEELDQILPVTRRPLQLPKIELLKQELRRYFQLESLRKGATLEMYEKIDQIARTLTPEQREMLGDALHDVVDLEAKREIALDAGIQIRFDTEVGENLFFELLTIFIPYSSDLLLSSLDIIESSVGEEIAAYLEEPFDDKPFLPAGKRVFLLVLSKLTPLIPHLPKIELYEFIQELDRNPKAIVPFAIPKDIQTEWGEFLDLFIEKRNVPLVIEEESFPSVELYPEYLCLIERNTKNTLEKICSLAQVQIVFRQYGRDISLGSVPQEEPEFQQHFGGCWELDDETVLV